MKKALKAITALLAAGLLFSSCIFVIGGLDEFGEGSASTPVIITGVTHQGYVGYGSGNESFYRFTTPTGLRSLTISTTSVSADLDYYLYSDSGFSTEHIKNDSSSLTTSGDVLEDIDVEPGTTYYLKVRNYTNTERVAYTLTFTYTVFETIFPISYDDRSNWIQGNLPAGETLWYEILASATSSSVYIHWQDYSDNDSSSSLPTADIKVAVYASKNESVLQPSQDNGYHSDWAEYGVNSGHRVTDRLSYWVKVEGVTSSDSGSFYLCAVEEL